MTNLDRLHAAFKRIESLDGIAKPLLACCNNHAHADLEAIIDLKISDPSFPIRNRTLITGCFYSKMSANAIRLDGSFVQPVNIGHRGPTELILDSLVRAGLTVEWSGDPEHAIMVLP